MIDRDHMLPITRQASLLDINRTSCSMTGKAKGGRSLSFDFQGLWWKVRKPAALSNTALV